MKKILTILSFGLLFLPHCKDIGEQLPPLESSVVISPFEELSSTERHFLLNCATEKIYGCINFQIIHRFSVEPGSIRIWFDGISNPDVCLTALGPARATLDLGSLPNGTYTVVISDVTQATLQVSSERYVILPNLNASIRFDHKTLNRIPPNTYWGFIGYGNSNASPLAQSFVDSMQLLGSRPIRFAAGYYGYFETDSSGFILPNPNMGYYYVKPVGQTFDGDTQTIRALVKRFGKTYGDYLSIRVSTWRGENYYSWVLRYEP